VSTIPSFRDAWQDALYGEHGFYRRNAPAEHFRTSVHASPLFATAIVRLAREVGATAITDIGAGRGELGKTIRTHAPDLEVYDVELDDELPDVLTGLVIANEWLDNIPCDVVELDDEPRYVLADGSLGDVAEGNDREWLDRWWPLAERGDRAEIGRAREEAWASVVRRVADGAAVAIDYGHHLSSRPPHGTLSGYRHGRPCDPVPDGSCDITAHVALDALAAAAPGSVVTTQREALLALGLDARRPDIALATADPRRYLAELSAAGEAAELIDPSGLGGFGWVWSFAGTARVPDWLVSRSARIR
jgi:SAM-dependent MidA family methyltransferase